ncbi:DUF6412 domain-containing protein [Nocardia sp. CDC153]|uniref:DUF6412 domain-containing protein n=1 Tax=Nocardia sp. CDC153 TaxID=3112167 RepID=UPI002DBFBB90|nr:DUF6412 domain-containing protein [Nocardia sp. CDC153]MEC3958831.1 DUF6412 domain-containing protein [Nocardia sp. CDC153]
MVNRIRSTALPLGALVVSAWAVLYLAAATPDSLFVLGAVAVVAVTAALLSARGPLLVAVAQTGPAESAGRRRRGTFLRQSNPDAPGRPRPRAPGVLAA